MTNETPQPNENKHQRMRSETPNVAELSDAVTALITAWLEVAPEGEGPRVGQ